jgi:hypothetical protein
VLIGIINNIKYKFYVKNMNYSENKNREETVKYYLKCIEELMPLDNLILYNAMEKILIQLWYNAYKFGGDNNEDMRNNAYGRRP